MFTEIVWIGYLPLNFYLKLSHDIFRDLIVIFSSLFHPTFFSSSEDIIVSN